MSEHPEISFPLRMVYADVEVGIAGKRHTFYSVRVWDALPRCWNSYTQDQRQEWLEKYFIKALHLHAGDDVQTVTMRVHKGQVPSQ